LLARVEQIGELVKVAVQVAVMDRVVDPNDPALQEGPDLAKDEPREDDPQ
jgi:hypothetical protein